MGCGVASCGLALTRNAADTVAAYNWKLPPGFPIPLVPADNPMSAAKVQLGRRLFSERRLSLNGAYACESCHQRQLAYTDGRPVALGATGERTRRSAMSLANVAYNVSYGWSDPSIGTLEAQMLRPLFSEHPIEMGLRHHEAQVVATLAGDAGYRTAFAEAFPDDAAPVSIAHVIKAIAAFERTLISGRSAFDRFVFDDDQSALSPRARHGMELFYSTRSGCEQCHFGLNFCGPLRYQGHAKAQPLMANTGLYDLDGHGAYPARDRGLIEQTHDPADMGKMRVPSLRNVALTAPYMHDGSLATLEEVIDHYVEVGGRHYAHNRARTYIDPRLRPLLLSPQERSDLVAFLESLTDPEFVAAASD